MKRIILVTLFLSFFGFTPALASWEDSINNLPQTVPWEWNNTTFTHIAMYNYIPGYVLVAVYCPSATSITADYNYGALAIRSTADNTCRMFESDDNGATWLTNHWPFTYARNNQTPTSNLGDFIRSNRNVTATYTENWYGAWEFNSVTAGDRLIDSSSFGGFIVTKNLNITRSPELGGGVIVTVPPGFPEFQCGTDGQEECDFDVDYNAQVTLEAQHNEGYAFSHWVINNQTMGDTDGTITIPMNEDKNVVAVFARTFQDTAGNFDVTIGDECVIYVRNETGIICDACHGEAADCFEQAQAAGYATGSEPRESAIIVFDRVPGTALAVGHVGIVTSYNGDYVSMHDSNWVGHHTIGNHTELVGENGYNIKGYIYFTPHQ